MSFIGAADMQQIPRYGVLTVPDDCDGREGFLQFVDGIESGRRSYTIDV